MAYECEGQPKLPKSRFFQQKFKTIKSVSIFSYSFFFQEELMEGIIQEEGREATTKEDDIEYLIGSLGLVPPSSELMEQE